LPTDPQATENMARPERFELPTPWFVGRFERDWIFNSQ
jgi:hypothetical protein